MNASTAKATRRSVRRALGPAGVDLLTEQAARLAILETFVRQLNTSIWCRLRWVLTGVVHG